MARRALEGRCDMRRIKGLTFMNTRSLTANLGRILMLAAAGVSLATSAHAADRHVRIINATEHTMVRFYASNIDADDWQEDILGDSVVRPGDDVNINIDDGSGHCRFDFRAVFDDGEATVKHNIDVCSISSFRYTE